MLTAQGHPKHNLLIELCFDAAKIGFQYITLGIKMALRWHKMVLK